MLTPSRRFNPGKWSWQGEIWRNTHVRDVIMRNDMSVKRNWMWKQWPLRWWQITCVTCSWVTDTNSETETAWSVQVRRKVLLWVVQGGRCGPLCEFPKRRRGNSLTFQEKRTSFCKRLVSQICHFVILSCGVRSREEARGASEGDYHVWAHSARWSLSGGCEPNSSLWGGHKNRLVANPNHQAPERD